MRSFAPAKSPRRPRQADARVVVMGLGYVGAPMAELARTAGFEVHGLEVDAERAAALTTEDCPTSLDPSVLDRAALILVCVPTPLDDAGQPDRGPVLEAAATIRAHAGPRVRVCLESTVDPELAARGFAAAAGLPLDQVAHAPERLDPGPASRPARDIPRVVGGCTPAATAWAADFYRALGLQVHETTAEVAALAKLNENAQRLVNVALVGELARLCRARGVDVDAVIDACATKPFGYTPYRARAGAGGHCVPVDPVWLLDAARSEGAEFGVLRAALAANRARAADIVDAFVHTAPEARRVLVLGAAYKPGVGDTRESPAQPIALALAARGLEVRVHDPLTGGLSPYPATTLEDALPWAEAILALTVHDAMPVEALSRFPGPIVDACGDLRGLELIDRRRV
ncbi:putative UDP-glucose/GDP-mannose dehydrogenase [Plesiocystis pacifica SIR-1]|uniref:Putative UDP-glucose/GDP-mannose dehydrogenase n=1 Tax=Plesiocystis pacifica SIR-1 TaxID=391625 RepID=A6GG03_9BACT|nr:nucleotide sugar dehydrogenase [Plesiocystis pacifica]EDM75190.1 putative UDP-glucose/GDP-mannose dehydrogenase [Plesiocystis pacifica SIR-1]